MTRHLDIYALYVAQADRLTHENVGARPQFDHMPDSGSVETSAKQFSATARIIIGTPSEDSLEAEEQLVSLCEVAGVEYPRSRFGIGPSTKRLQDEKWWVRKLAIKARRKWEARQIADGKINKTAALYCSDWAVKQWRSMRRRNAEYMEGVFVFNDDAWLSSLAEIAKHSLANPAVRRAEMMTRLSGFEDYAKDQGHKAVFLTITCPSRYHGNSANYDGATPKQSNDYLCRVWARARAKLKREGLSFYGFRVAEPHNDGCPHWHAIIFADRKHLDRIVEIIQGYACETDAGELKTRGAKKARFHGEEIALQTWQPGYKGGAVAYVAKYISKNIDGKRSDGSSLGQVVDRNGEVVANDAIETAERVLAWASLWGIRQFQQVGGVSIGPYRELRRIQQQITGSAALEVARKAADNAGDEGFSAYIKAAQKVPLLATLKRCKFAEAYDNGDFDAAKEALNRYGEPVINIIGVTGDGEEIITRRDDWRCLSEYAIHSFYDEAAEKGEAVEFWADICEAVNLLKLDRELDSRELSGPPQASPLDLC